MSNQEALWNEAEAFISVCYEELNKSNEEKAARLHEIKKEIESEGSYTHTLEELAHGRKWHGATVTAALAVCFGRPCKCMTAGM